MFIVYLPKMETTHVLRQQMKMVVVAIAGLISCTQNETWTQQDERRFIYDGLDLIQERDGDNDVIASYVRDGNIGGVLSRTTSNGTFYYHYDGNGNVVAMTNSFGTIVAEYTYDAYGNLTSMSGSEAADNPIRFSTKYFDGDTGYYDFGFRSYDPVTGRWLNRDPIGEEGGLNLYGFVGNNPVNAVDPYGLYELWLYTTKVVGGFHHAFLVMHDKDSNGKSRSYYFEGNPQIIDSSNKTSTFIVDSYGDITCNTGDFSDPNSAKRKERSQRTSSSRLISAPGVSGSNARDRLYRTMQKIEGAGITYDPILGPNSNSVVRTLLEVGLGVKLGNAKTVTTQLGIWGLSGWDNKIVLK